MFAPGGGVFRLNWANCVIDPQLWLDDMPSGDGYKPRTPPPPPPPPPATLSTDDQVACVKQSKAVRYVVFVFFFLLLLFAPILFPIFSPLSSFMFDPYILFPPSSFTFCMCFFKKYTNTRAMITIIATGRILLYTRRFGLSLRCQRGHLLVKTNSSSASGWWEGEYNVTSRHVTPPHVSLLSFNTNCAVSTLTL